MFVTLFYFGSPGFENTRKFQSIKISSHSAILDEIVAKWLVYNSIVKVMLLLYAVTQQRNSGYFCYIIFYEII